ncbi:helix-turn-helix domain-containing protein [Niallia sp. HCP3S3_B10]|uniref:helix-turn-helix domain-containing protein n=1 Tax=Niallia sp. HCP3S3_B10 TaxID=3438944 RepID=UPI003F8C8283
MPTSLKQICLEDDVERLIILRKRLRLNQFQFAKEIGVSSSYLRKVESRRIPIPINFRKKVDEYLKQEQLIYEKGSNLYK